MGERNRLYGLQPWLAACWISVVRFVTGFARWSSSSYLELFSQLSLASTFFIVCFFQSCEHTHAAKVQSIIGICITATAFCCCCSQSNANKWMSCHVSPPNHFLFGDRNSPLISPQPLGTQNPKQYGWWCEETNDEDHFCIVGNYYSNTATTTARPYYTTKKVLPKQHN